MGEEVQLGTDMVLILSKLSSLDCWECTILKTKIGTFNSNLDRTSGKTVVMATAPQVLFFPFVMYISGTKFEEQCFNISRDILDSVFYYFSGTVYYVITFLISIIQKH